MIDEIRPKGLTKKLGKYMEELGISLSHLKTMSGRREVEGKITLQRHRNTVTIGDKELYCNRLGAVILFQSFQNSMKDEYSEVEAEARFCWQLGWAMDCSLGGAVRDTVAHFVTECVVLEGVRE